MYKSSIYTNMNAIIFVKIRTVIDLWIQNVTLFNYDKGNQFGYIMQMLQFN